MWKNSIATFIGAFWGIRGFATAVFGFLIGAPAAVYGYDRLRTMPMLTWLPDLTLMERWLWLTVIVLLALVGLFIVRFVLAATPRIRPSEVQFRDGRGIFVSLENMSAVLLGDVSLSVDDVIDVANPIKPYGRKGWDLRPPGPLPTTGHKFPLEPRKPTEVEIASFISDSRGVGLRFNFLANQHITADVPIPRGEYKVRLGIYGTGASSMQCEFSVAVNSDGFVCTKPSKCRTK